MKPIAQRAAETAIDVLLFDAMNRAQANLLGTPHQAITLQRLKTTTDLIAKALAAHQDEILAAQQETAVALAAALNLAGGKNG